MVQKKEAANASDERIGLSVRIPGALRDQIEKAAKANGVNLTEEIVRRLEQSFALDQERQKMLDSFGGLENYEAYQRILQVVMLLKNITGKDWRDNAWVCGQTAEGAAELFRLFGARGDYETPPKFLKKPPGDGIAVGRELAGIIHVFGSAL